MWLSLTTPRERRTLLAGFLGYGLDGFDFMIYTFLIPTLLVVFRMSNAQAGYIATAALATSAIGGWGAGVLADRLGRVRVLQWTVAWFAVFTCLSGFTHTYAELLCTRALQGFGFGGEWAVGSVLVAETIDARHRGKAVGLVQSSWAVGWAAAAIAYWGVYALVPAATAWKIIFWVGIAPALLVVYLRRKVQESDLYLSSQRARSSRHADPRATRREALAILGSPLLRTTLLASTLCCGMMGAYYSVTTWLPTYLAKERHLSVTGTSGYLLVLIGGSFCGYLVGAWLSDALGRRRCFMLYAACGALLVVAYTYTPITDAQMLALGFPLGFFLSGIFSGMGAFLAELYPSAVRGSGQGFCYSLGRAVGAFFPAIIGQWSARSSLGACIGVMTATGYALVIAAAWTLPETHGRTLAE
jgi:MFS family permease